MPRRGLVVPLLAVVAVAGYGVYHWQNAVPPGLQDRRIIASAIESNQATVNPTVASAVPTVTLATPKSLLQLHAAFRESQRYMEERIIIRGILSYYSGAQAPPHIPGCDDMKGALRKEYEATNAAAKSGDIDAQMCYLMQGAGDRESGFVLSDAEIAEYQSLGRSTWRRRSSAAIGAWLSSWGTASSIGRDYLLALSNGRIRRENTRRISCF
jgi:hypothetical protein